MAENGDAEMWVDPNRADEKQVCKKCGREYTFRQYSKGCPFCLVEWMQRWLAFLIIFLALIYALIYW